MLDLKSICRWARTLPGGERLTDHQMQRAIQNSTVFGLYLGPFHEQIGFARVVSDAAAFSAITEVYVDEPHRKKGYGSILMQTVVAHGSVKHTLCILQCRPELQPFYRKFGFEPQGGAVMMRGPG